MIDYHLLEALHAVISEGGFERAAKTLFITQSAVSRRIHHLESSMGEPVIIRNKPPMPTPFGQRLLNHYQQVRQLEIALALPNLDEQTKPSPPLLVKLATNADSLATWLPEALAVSREKTAQQYQFDIVVDDQSVALKRMKSGEVMACVCSSKTPVNGGKSLALGAMRYHIVASPRFVDTYRYSNPSELAKLPCLVFDENDKLQHQFLADLGAQSPTIVHYCPSTEGFLQAALAGLGFGLLPALQLANTIESGVLVDLMPGHWVDVALYWHYWQTESPPLMILREHVLAVASKRLESL
ncbi:LysR family transcriptional regulator ArgP [Agaribacter flavus]|uniref:LysR family transcriptional regulator ArgP n=1 Tax=Agaribacter flavus TaxID=1902781 RepID=A0ABV7FNX6_9ALTE